jgi:hypothetical protein
MKTGFINYALLIFIICPAIAGKGLAQPAQDFLPGIHNAIPAPWTCQTTVPSDSLDWPLFSASFVDTVHQITGCGSLSDHPNLLICLYADSLRDTIAAIIKKQEVYSWCIPIKYLESARYFIVTSPCYINSGCFSVEAKKLIAPLDSVLNMYFNPTPTAKWDSVIVDPHIFSGRPDPRFVIHDSVNVALVRHKVDSLHTELAVRGVGTPQNRSWWPGLRVTYEPPSFSSMLYYPLETGHDSIACTYSNETRTVVDKGRAFQQFIIDILIKENPISIRGNDTIGAAELFRTFPVFTGISPDRHSPSPLPGGKEKVSLRSNGGALDYSIGSAKRVTVELFDGKGRRIDVLYSGILQPGSSRIALPRKAAANGAGVVRVRTDNRIWLLRATYVR